MLSSLSSTIMTVFAIPDLPAAQRRWQLGHDGKRLVAIPYGKANAGHHAALADKSATKRRTRGIRRLEPTIATLSRPTHGRRRSVWTTPPAAAKSRPPAAEERSGISFSLHLADSIALPSAARW